VKAGSYYHPVTPSEAPHFDDAIRLSLTSQEIVSASLICVAQFLSYQRLMGPNAEIADMGTAPHQARPISICCRIMQSENVRVERVLVNSTLGTLRDARYYLSSRDCASPDTAVIGLKLSI
jgi:hypothetical protein